MMLIVFMCFSFFLAVQGDSIYVHENFTSTSKAYLPGHEKELINGKYKKVIKTRSIGRQVDISAADVKSMEQAPFSALSTILPANQKIILDSHNKYRGLANPTASNMLKLVWNDEARIIAGNWARKCEQKHSLLKDRKIKSFTCGENIFLSNFKVPWNVVVDSWHSEVVDFVFGKGPREVGIEVGHYTQLMWGSSQCMGCDVAECPNAINKYMYVCHLCPAGNRGDINTPYKKGPPCGECSKSCNNNLCNNPCPYEDKFSNCKDYKTGDTCGNDQSLVSDCPAMCRCTNGLIS
ncbi:cysteine-rich venom protein-like [Mixophyes fleayi]|uniref:cysteine-rich venom protein-like n=1 Tax=Mixophyes fleayi TaxID=3061075 RepID=UPI003F4DBEDE